MSLTNFIDYENIEPGIGPIRRINQIFEQRNLKKSQRQIAKFSFVEHKVEL